MEAVEVDEVLALLFVDTRVLSSQSVRSVSQSVRSVVLLRAEKKWI
mgnify:CR=1 FL=1